MVVIITNISDEPGDKKVSPTAVDVYNKTLAPGSTMKLPAELVDAKVRKLGDQGLIAIGQVPPWYSRAKQNRRGRLLSKEERAKRIVTPPTPKAPVQELPIKKPPVLGFVELVDTVGEPEEEVKLESKSKRR